MSLDIYLQLDEPIIKKKGSGIFIRENGQTKEISWTEWYARYPDRQPYVFNPDGSNETEYETIEAWHGNITHNLIKMAKRCGAYQVCWQPRKIKVNKARSATFLLLNAIHKLKKEPDKYKKSNPPNGWGSYEVLLSFLQDYHQACIQYPDAEIITSV